jgi:hypothetical protein
MFYAFHPCLTNALCWISARKHLLSTFYILAASVWFISFCKTKQTKNILILFFSITCICFLYLLACFSQPINIAWPIWCACYYYIHIQHDSKEPLQKYFLLLMSLLFTILFLTYFINNQYYSSTYINQTIGQPKYIDNQNNLFSYKILAIGASFFQLILPLWPTPSSYYPGSYKNLIGLVLFIISLFAIYKISNIDFKKHILTWVLFALLPLMVMNFKLTNIFGSDTYLLIPVLGCYTIFALIFSQIKLPQLNYLWIKLFYVSMGTMLIFYFYNSNQVSKSWETEKSLWTLAQQNEETPVVLKNLANYYLSQKNYEASFELAEKMWNWNPALRDADHLYAMAVYFHPKFTIENKIILLNKALIQTPRSAWLKYFIASLYASKQQWLQSYELMQTIQPIEFIIFSNEISVITADYIFFCKNSKIQLLDKCAKIQSELSNLHSNVWNESVFSARLNLLLPK